MGRTSAELDECQRHESLLNFAFDGSPAWSLLCPYDSAQLDDGVLEAASHCHPFVAEGPTAAENFGCLNLDAQPFAGSLPPRPSDAETMTFGREGLSAVRQLVSRAAAAAGLSRVRREDIMFAASELASNSIAHGGGTGTIAVWTESGGLLVEAEDRGRIETSLVGRLRP